MLCDALCKPVNLRCSTLSAPPITHQNELTCRLPLQENLVASFNILKCGAPLLAAAGGGSIACVGATVVQHGMKHHEAFAAAKGAVEGKSFQTADEHT